MVPLCLENLQDVCYTLTKEPVAVFDNARAAQDHNDHLYSMEELKKERKRKRKIVPKPPHIIFFQQPSTQIKKWSRGGIKLTDKTESSIWIERAARAPWSAAFH